MLNTSLQIYLFAFAVAGIAVTGCNGLLPFLSGGALDGPVASAPTDWSSFEPTAIVQLETRPTDPYSVNIASTIVGDALYINAGDTETEWVKHISADPNVRLRMSGSIYTLRAERVTDADEIERFGRAWTAQGAFHRDPSKLSPVWIYRLVAP